MKKESNNCYSILHHIIQLEFVAFLCPFGLPKLPALPGLTLFVCIAMLMLSMLKF